MTERKKRAPDAYDDHMDELVKRISRVVNGERFLDVASAAACIVGYSVREACDEPAARLRTLNELYKFMMKIAIELSDADYARDEEDAERKRDAAEGFPDD